MRLTGCCFAVQATLIYAAEVTAGVPFVLKLALQSHAPLLQTFDVALKDSTGFVTSGQWLPAVLCYLGLCDSGLCCAIYGCAVLCCLGLGCVI